MTEDAGPSRDTPRWRGLLPAAGALAVLAAVLVLGLTLGGGGDDDAGGLGYLDGIVVSADPTLIVLRPFRPVEGQTEVEMRVRPRDVAALDVEHLRAHAADGTPARIFYERRGGDYVARDATDAPRPGG